jgi:hypothetical protein
VKQRIEQVERMAAKETTASTIGEVEIVRNTEAARLQIKFPDKPDTAVRKVLKSHGFRWAPSQGAWQRFLNGNGEYALKQVIPTLEEHYQ